MLCLEPHGRGPCHLIFIHQISATPLEKHMDSNQMLQINTDLNAWRVILCQPVCIRLRNILKGQWRWWRRETAVLYHALWIQHCPQNYSSSPNRSPGKPRGRLKDGENMPRVKFHSWCFYIQQRQEQSATHKGPITFSEKKKKKESKIVTLG